MTVYVEVAGCSDNASLVQAAAVVSTLGAVVDRGVGTASGPDIAWFEVDRGAVEPVVAALRCSPLERRLRKVVLVDGFKGRLLAKQLELF